MVRGRPLSRMGLTVPGLFGEGVLAITPDDRGIAEAVRERLTACGIRAEITAEIPHDARAVLYLGGLRAVRNVDEAVAVNREAFATAVSFVQRPREGGGLFVTVQDTGGDLGVSGTSGARAWLAGLAALAKTAAQEWPDTCARAIDIAAAGRDSATVAEALVQELLEGGDVREVGLSRTGQRTTLESVAAAATTTAALPGGGVIVASGGARGVTAECLLALARQMGPETPRVLLLGRTALEEEPAYLRDIDGDAALKRAVLAVQTSPDALTPRTLARLVERITAGRDIRNNLTRFAALGVTARYESIDVRDPEGVAALLRDVREAWGPIDILVHGAGVLSDAPLEKRTGTAEFDAVFDTKVRGLAALLSATQDDPLRWICLFSSVAARDGNAGQADYAMANEVLNKVAAVEARSRPGCHVTSLGWGPWDGGMVTPALARHFASRGVGLIPLETGAEAFVSESRAHGDVEVLVGGAGLPPEHRTVTAQLLVTPAAFPHLEDHRVHGAVVLPVVIAIDAFARLCARGGETGAPLALGDLRVLRGLVMPGFASRPHVLALALAPDGRLELRDADGATRISARWLAGDVPAPTPTPALGAVHGIALSGPIYGPDRLFHGPRFQLIRNVTSLSADEAVASVAGVVEAGWATSPSPCDPAMLDAGLQLALLAGLCPADRDGAGMGQTLPLAIERVILHRPPARGPILCSLRTRSRTNARAQYDIVFTDESRQLLAQLKGVEMYAVPSGTAGTASP